METATDSTHTSKLYSPVILTATVADPLWPLAESWALLGFQISEARRAPASVS